MRRTHVLRPPASLRRCCEHAHGGGTCRGLWGVARRPGPSGRVWWRSWALPSSGGADCGAVHPPDRRLGPLRQDAVLPSQMRRRRRRRSGRWPRGDTGRCTAIGSRSRRRGAGGGSSQHWVPAPLRQTDRAVVVEATSCSSSAADSLNSVAPSGCGLSPRRAAQPGLCRLRVAGAADGGVRSGRWHSGACAVDLCAPVACRRTGCQPAHHGAPWRILRATARHLRITARRRRWRRRWRWRCVVS